MTDKENSKTNDDFKISQYITYVAPFLIFLGVIRLTVFYKSFGISIISYLEFSEILTSFLDILSIVIIFYAYTSIQNYLMSNKDETDQAHIMRQEILKQQSFLKSIRHYFEYLKSALLLIFLVIIGFVIAYFLNGVTAWTLAVIITTFISLFIFIIVGIEIERKHLHFQSSLIRKRFYFLLLYSLVLVMGVTLYSFYQVRQIKVNKSTYGVSITLDDNQIIVSDSLNYYVGKTQNYFFIYHEKLRTTDVFPMSRVKQMTMTNRILDEK